MDNEFNINQALIMIGELYVKERLATDRTEALLAENLSLRAQLAEFNHDESVEAGIEDEQNSDN